MCIVSCSIDSGGIVVFLCFILYYVTGDLFTPHMKGIAKRPVYSGPDNVLHGRKLPRFHLAFTRRIFERLSLQARDQSGAAGFRTSRSILLQLPSDKEGRVRGGGCLLKMFRYIFLAFEI